MNYSKLYQKFLARAKEQIKETDIPDDPNRELYSYLRNEYLIHASRVGFTTHDIPRVDPVLFVLACVASAIILGATFSIHQNTMNVLLYTAISLAIIVLLSIAVLTILRFRDLKITAESEVILNILYERS